MEAVAVSSDGAWVASGDRECTVRVWDLATGQEIAWWTADPGTSLLACCTVQTNASLIVYGDFDGGVHVLSLLEAVQPT